MPQITVTLDSDTYMTLTHYLAKGKKSRFVNMAVAAVIQDCSIKAGNSLGLPPMILGNVLNCYALEGPDAAFTMMGDECKRLVERKKHFPFEFRREEE